MTTIKSYTTIEQSRKLAKILPLESADMCWQQIYDENHMMSDYRVELIPYRLYSGIGVPCWSLAALISIIPYNMTFNKAVYRFKLVKFSDHWECYHENFGSVSTEIFKADNPVDACIAMIVKLHGLKML